MNIGLLTYTLSERSGARAPIRLAEELHRRGHKLTVYGLEVGKDQQMVSRLENEGIRVVSFPADLRLPFSLRGYTIIPKLLGELKKAHHDVLSFHSTLPFMIASKLSGVKVLKTYYGTQLSDYQIRKDANLSTKYSALNIIKSLIFDILLKVLEWISLTLSNRTFSISKFLAEEVHQFYGKKIGVIYLGAESSLLKTDSKQNVGSERYILSVSRIVPYKGFDLLIEAFKKLSERVQDLKLIIVGSVADEGYLNYLKGLANDKVEFRKNVTDQELSELYRGCNLYASADLWVPWSLTPLEASFFARPLLGLDFGAMNEIIQNGENGLLASNVEELSEKIFEIVNDQELAKKLGENAFKKVTNYSWQKTALEYEKELEKLI